jgi:hypothetical protein
MHFTQPLTSNKTTVKPPFVVSGSFKYNFYLKYHGGIQPSFFQIIMFLFILTPFAIVSSQTESRKLANHRHARGYVISGENIGDSNR